MRTCSRCNGELKKSKFTHAYCSTCEQHITYIRLDGGESIFGESEIIDNLRKIYEPGNALLR